MNLNLKHKALKNLARTSGDKAQAALDKEAQKIEAVLSTTTQMDLLEEQLDLLESIAFRISEKTIEISLKLLKRLDEITLTYEPVESWVSYDQAEYHNKNTLIKKILEIVERVRYYQPGKALDIFFRYAAFEEEEVRRQAKHGLKSMAEFNLEVFKQIGLTPQNLVMEKIGSLSQEEKKKFLSSVVALCDEMLSPTMEGVSWSYKSVTIKTGALPASKAVEDVREKTLKILTDFYPLAETPAEKRSIINALQQSTRTPSNTEYSDDFLNLILRNTIRVLKFYKQIIPGEDLEIIQKIEHDSFWLARRGVQDEVVATALTIKDELDRHAEYQIFKHLIGFEGVFQNWNKLDDEDFKATRQLREDKAREYARSINEDNYEEWKSRIMLYSQIQSNDMATFPVFGKFLEFFGNFSPKLALRLLNEEGEKLERFIIVLLIGIWETDERNAARAFIQESINNNLHLYVLTRFFEFNSEIDEGILHQLLGIAIDKNDKSILAQIVVIAAKSYKGKESELSRSLFFPAIQHLTKLEEAGWVFNYWYMDEGKKLIENLEEKDCQLVLDNLIYLPKIDYHAEEILFQIAKKFSALVLNFFGSRLAYKASAERNYDAVPFSFYKLAPALAVMPGEAIEIVASWYDNYGSFIHGGANLLKIIFPDFPETFEKSLLSFIKAEDEKTLMIVMAVLRNYEGEIQTHSVNKALISALPENHDYLKEIEVALESTGVVGGEFGFVEAYMRKKEEVSPWLTDPDEKVRKFAVNYMAMLDAMITLEHRRATEREALGKFEWGEGEEEK